MNWIHKNNLRLLLDYTLDDDYDNCLDGQQVTTTIEFYKGLISENVKFQIVDIEYIHIILLQSPQKPIWY